MNAKSRRVRYTLFSVLSAVFLVTFASNDRNEWYDACLIQYAVTATTSAACFALYIYWWIRQGRATEVYAWLTVLLGALLLSALLTYRARWLFVYVDMESYSEYIRSSMWEWRQVPLTIVLFYMLALIVGRLVGSHADNENKKDGWKGQ